MSSSLIPTVTAGFQNFSRMVFDGLLSDTEISMFAEIFCIPGLTENLATIGIDGHPSDKFFCRITLHTEPLKHRSNTPIACQHSNNYLSLYGTLMTQNIFTLYNFLSHLPPQMSKYCIIIYKI